MFHLIYSKIKILRIVSAVLFLSNVFPARSDDRALTKISSALTDSGRTAVIGGIGTGYLSLNSHGSFGPVVVGYRESQPAFLPIPSCFASVWTNQQGNRLARSLTLNSAYSLPSIGAVEFTSLFPSALLNYLDRLLPVKISQKIFTPILPGDIRNSTLSAAIFIFNIENHSPNLVQCSVAVSWKCLIDNPSPTDSSNFVNSGGYKISKIPASEGLFGLKFIQNSNKNVDVNTTPGKRPSRYEMALLTMPTQAQAVVNTASWNPLESTPAWWKEYALEGTVSGSKISSDSDKSEPAGVIAVKLNIQPRASIDIPFAVVWAPVTSNIPAKSSQTPSKEEAIVSTGRRVLLDFQSLSGLTEEWQKKIQFSNIPSNAAQEIINSAAILLRIGAAQYSFSSPQNSLNSDSSTTLSDQLTLSEAMQNKLLHIIRRALFPQMEGSEQLKYWKAANVLTVGKSNTLHDTTFEELVKISDEVDSLNNYVRESGDVSLIPHVLPFLRKFVAHYYQSDDKNLLPNLHFMFVQAVADLWLDLLKNTQQLTEIGSKPISPVGDSSNNLTSVLNTIDNISEANLNKKFADSLKIRILGTQKIFAGMFPRQDSAILRDKENKTKLDWIWMESLGGFKINRISGEITLNPSLPDSWRSLSLPLFSPTFWGHLQYKPLAGGVVFNLRVDRMIPLASADPNWNTDVNAGLNFKKIIFGSLPPPSPGTTLRSPSIHASLRQNPLGVSANTLPDGAIELIFDVPVNMAAGDNLQVEVHR